MENIQFLSKIKLIMKTFYILLLFPVFTSTQIITFPDDNLITKLLDATATNEIARDINGNSVTIDINSDGEIELSEA